MTRVELIGTGVSGQTAWVSGTLVSQNKNYVVIKTTDKGSFQIPLNRIHCIQVT